MKKRIDINGEALRQEREQRALTQEELSEKSRLGVRTLRRLEAGQGTLDALRRVSEALAAEPRVLFEPTSQDRHQQVRDTLQFDLLSLEVSGELLPLLVRESPFWERIKSMRRHLALELGVCAPGIRVRDVIGLEPHTYRLCVRESQVATGTVYTDRILAIGGEDRVGEFIGERVVDPTYGMPGVWVSVADRPRGLELGCLVFTAIDIIVTHLTHIVRTHIGELFEVDELQWLLEVLARPVLVAELTAQMSLGRIAGVLRSLLREGVSIRDLGLILETLLEEPSEERVRVALGPQICREWRNAEGKIPAVVVKDDRWLADLGDFPAEFAAMGEALSLRGLPLVIVCSPALRPRIRDLRIPRLTCLSWSEVDGPIEEVGQL